MRIQQLSKALANQIAAGEVIERPASVVKELLENALDAGADSISIDLGFGGLTQIKVSDNGSGIVAEDLPLAIAAHATSKISQLKDLYAIASMGFRGEALASIASISRLSISSKPVEQEHAMKLSFDNEGSIRVEPCARSRGTTVEVSDLFFNAPVRKKFLKSEGSEFQAIEFIVKRFALSAPQIAINLSHNGKQVLNLTAANCDKTRVARIRKLLGKTFVDQSCSLEVEQAGLRLQGFISTKNYQRSQNDKIWVYVNGRMVKDKLLNHAIRQAYESLLHPGRHPACLLYLSINPQEVDVNVHPTKHEVRFQQPRLVHDFLSSNLKKALTPRADYQMETLNTKAFQVNEPYKATPLVSKEPLIERKNWIILNESFALLFLAEKPYLVDVIAIQRNWLLSILTKEKLPLASRPLLVPLSFPYLLVGWEELNACIQALSQLGIELSVAGEQSLLIRSLPQAVPHLDLKQFLTLCLAEKNFSVINLLKLLTLCQSFNLKHLGFEEAAILIDYIEVLAEDKKNPLCKHLSIETCWDLLNA